MHLLNGKFLAKGIREIIAKQVSESIKKPCLAVVLVGENNSSETYVRNKEKSAREVGFSSIVKRCPKDISQQDLESVVYELNQNPEVDGLIVQLPVPDHINLDKVINLISPIKDVDGFTLVNQGLLFRGDSSAIIPATPRGILELLMYYRIYPRGQNIVIVGRSMIVGKPLANLLLKRGDKGDATVTVAHSETRKLRGICENADILIAAVGKPKFITDQYVKQNAVVVDVGINHVDGVLCGDVDFDSVKKKTSFITPVPGGVGPMTIAMLLQNTLEASIKRFSGV